MLPFSIIIYHFLGWVYHMNGILETHFDHTISKLKVWKSLNGVIRARLVRKHLFTFFCIVTWRGKCKISSSIHLKFVGLFFYPLLPLYILEYPGLKRRKKICKSFLLCLCFGFFGEKEIEGFLMILMRMQLELNLGIWAHFVSGSKY